MTKRQVTAVFGGLLVTLYPFLIYFGLDAFNPRWLSLLLIVAVGLRFLDQRMPKSFVVAFAVALVGASAITLATGRDLGLLLYPVLVNVLLFALFLASWWHPPSIIETLARFTEPDLPPSGVAYTRTVTLVWAVFFAINGSIAAFTITQGKAWWTLYNGFIAYLLIGTLFAVEWLVRQKVRKRADG